MTPALDPGCVPPRSLLAAAMQESAARHRHLCPRQVLGIRLGLAGLRRLGLVDERYQPRFDNRRKRLLAICETDGCGADGVAAVTDCHVGKRTLRILDFGKVAVTLVDTRTGAAVRVSPASQVREVAARFAPQAPSRWHAYLEAYQHIPDDLLVRVKAVALTQTIAEIISKPNRRAICQQCGEEILNEREVYQDERLLCRSCAGESYYCEL